MKRSTTPARNERHPMTKTSTTSRLSVKAVKLHEDMSQETTCFSATIYFDGKRLGKVMNEGCGGCHRYEFGKGLRELEAWANEQETEYKSEKLDQLVEIAMNLFLNAQADKRWLARKSKTSTPYRLVGDEEGSWRCVNAPLAANVFGFLAKKYGADQIAVIHGVDEKVLRTSLALHGAIAGAK